MEKSFFLFVLLPVLSLFSLIQPYTTSTTKRYADSKQNFYQYRVENPKCTDCHSDLIESTIIHSPALQSCENCHQVDIQDHTVNGAKGLHLTQKVPDLCYTCHDGIQKEIADSPNVHEAIKSENSCTTCHSPHSSYDKKLLVSEQKKLCLSCHNKDVSANGEKTVNIKKLISTGKVIHPPVEKGCVVCHQPHASANNYLLISAFPKGEYASAIKDTFALCWECHDSDLLEVSKTTTSTNFRDGDRNLHFVHMNGKKARSCVMCHNVHASMNDHLIEDNVRFGDWNLPIRFTPKENGGSCFPGCHAQKSYTY